MRETRTVNNTEPSQLPALRYARWTGRSDRFRRAVLPCAVVFFLVFGSIAYAIFSPIRSPVIVVAAFLIVIAFFARAQRSQNNRIAALIGRGEDEIPVIATLLVPGWDLSLGDDFGLLCHEAGWLVFRGERTEWSVRSADVTVLPQGEGFRFPGPAGTIRMMKLRKAGSGRAVSLYEEWLLAERPAGEAVFPPVTGPADRLPWLRFETVLLSTMVAFGFLVALFDTGPVRASVASMIAFAISLPCLDALFRSVLRRNHALPEPPE